MQRWRLALILYPFSKQWSTRWYNKRCHTYKRNSYFIANQQQKVQLTIFNGKSVKFRHCESFALKSWKQEEKKSGMFKDGFMYVNISVAKALEILFTHLTIHIFHNTSNLLVSLYKILLSILIKILEHNFVFVFTLLKEIPLLAFSNNTFYLWYLCDLHWCWLQTWCTSK